MVYLISACLLGEACRYDGQSKPIPPAIAALAAEHTLIPVCPEVLGGLPTPRPPAERQGERIVTCEGGDVTDAYRRGAEEVLRLCRLHGAAGVILKNMSPSCGTRGIYDGSFTRTRTEGLGVTAALLLAEGIAILDEDGCAAMTEEK
ncbi:MAG: DUF523 domain-containing protein [Clostridia bacterium]|nr:DUF523 domain-containing protein [Clostridia bacterium]